MERARLLWTCSLIVGSLLAASPALASGSTSGTNLVYRGAPTRIVAAAAVSFAGLARLEGQRPLGVGPPTPYLLPEPQEKPEPQAHITAPSPFEFPLGLPEAGPNAPSPSPAATFFAQGDVPRTGTTTSVIPPDTDGAVGLTKLMVTLNNNYVVEDKSTGAVLSTVSMPAFWSAVGAASAFDPKTVYDPYNNRWIVSAVTEAGTAGSAVLVGISDTSDPSAAWHLYRVDVDSADVSWADYPTLGFNKNWVAIHVNMFANATNVFSQGRLLLIDYPSLRAFAPSAALVTGLPSFTTQPAVTYSARENALYMVEHVQSATGTYRFWKVTAGPPAPAVTLVGGTTRANPLGGWALPGGNILPQSGGAPIDSGDARILNAVYRNGNIYYAQTVGLPASGLTHTAVQWTELSANGTFVQGGRVQDASGARWYAFPTISANAHNDVLLGFSSFAPAGFPSAAYTFHAGGDAASTMRDPVILKAGEGSYWKTYGEVRNRWGDYSNVQVDPSDDTSLWAILEYAAAPVGSGDGSGRWGTWWGKVPGTSGPEPPPPPPPPPPPFTPPKCVVPYVLGRRLSPAKARIRARHCRVGKVSYSVSTRRRKGRVVKEKPAPRRRLRNGAKVNLWIGRGPAR
jgi:hypothetical protein